MNRLSNQPEDFFTLSPSRLLHWLSASCLLLPISLFFPEGFFFFLKATITFAYKVQPFLPGPSRFVPWASHSPVPHPTPQHAQVQNSSVRFSELLLTPAPFFAHLVSSPWNPPPTFISYFFKTLHRWAPAGNVFSWFSVQGVSVLGMPPEVSPCCSQPTLCTWPPPAGHWRAELCLSSGQQIGCFNPQHIRPLIDIWADLFLVLLIGIVTWTPIYSKWHSSCRV